MDISTLDPSWIHRNIGIVTQEPTLFATTIKKNITYAIGDSREVSNDELIQAAQAANAHDFIMTLRDQYNTLLGE